MSQKKILFLFPRSPFNYNISNDKRQFMIYSTLKERFQTKILTFATKSLKADEEEITPLNSSDIKKIFNFIFQLQSPRITHYKSKQFRNTLGKTLKSFNPDIIFIEHVLMMQYIIDFKTDAKIVFFNDESNWFVEENNLRGSFYQSLRNIGLVKLEKLSCSRADLILTITPEEEKFLKDRGIKQVETITYGVDTDYFQFGWKNSEKRTILFVGDFSHYPNRHAAEILVKKILPKLADLKVKIKIVGRNTNRIKTLYRGDVTIYDNVLDIRKYYYNSSILVAPIFVGAGMRIKILEAALTGIPLVISPLSNLGINFLNRDEAFICNSLSEFITVLRKFFIEEFMNDLKSMGYNARNKVVNNFNEEKIKQEMISIFMKYSN